MKKLFLAMALLTSLGQSFATTHDDPTLKWGPCPEIFPKTCEVTVLHGEPAKPKADVFIRVPPKYTFPSHTHTSPEHMILISGEMTIQQKGQDAVIATAGTYLYGPAKSPHKAQCSDKGQCVLFVAFETPIDAAKSTDF